MPYINHAIHQCRISFIIAVLRNFASKNLTAENFGPEKCAEE